MTRFHLSYPRDGGPVACDCASRCDHSNEDPPPTTPSQPPVVDASSTPRQTWDCGLEKEHPPHLSTGVEPGIPCPGIPGPPRPSWDQTWLAVAHVVAARSLCVRDRVGAVIVDPRNRIVSTGYNGPPAGYAAEGSCSSWCDRSAWAKATDILQTDYSDCPSLHAELNALSVCDRSVREGGTIYVTSAVCLPCAKVVANSGLARVVITHSTDAAHRDPARSVEFLRRCGLEVVTWRD